MNNQELITRLHETSQALEQLAQHLSEMNQNDNTSDDPATETESTESASTSAETQTETATEPADADDSETDELIIETTFEPIDSDPSDNNSNKEAKKAPQTVSAQTANQNNNNPFAKIVNNLLNKPLPNASNMSGFNPLQMLAGGLPGLSGLNGLPGLGGFGGLNTQSLPTTLAELHDNPQLLGMLKNVSSNPQMLNMLSVLTGQDSQTLQKTLQGLQPGAAPAENITPNNAQPAQTAQASPNTAAPQTAPTFSAAAMPNAISNDLPANVSTTPYLDSLLNEWHWQPYARAWEF